MQYGSPEGQLTMDTAFLKSRKLKPCPFVPLCFRICRNLKMCSEQDCPSLKSASSWCKLGCRKVQVSDYHIATGAFTRFYHSCSFSTVEVMSTSCFALLLQ